MFSNISPTSLTIKFLFSYTVVVTITFRIPSLIFLPSQKTNTLIAGITPCHPNQINPTTVPPSDPQEIPAMLSLCLPQYQIIPPVKINILPDSGASICLASPLYIAKLKFGYKTGHKVTNPMSQTSLCHWKYKTALQRLAANSASSRNSSHKTACIHL